MARNSIHDPELRPLERSRAEQLTMLVDQAARSNSLLVIDPDTGSARAVMPTDNLNPEDPVQGIHLLGLHCRQLSCPTFTAKVVPFVWRRDPETLEP